MGQLSGMAYSACVAAVVHVLALPLRIWGQGRAAASGKTESQAWDRMPRLTPCHANVRLLTLHIGVTIHNIIGLDTVWGRALRLRLAVATEGATARETLRYPYSTL